MMYKTEPHLHVSEVSPCAKIGAEEVIKLYSEAGCIKLLFKVLGKKISFSAASGYAGTDLLYSNISPAQLAGLPAAGYSMHKDGIDAASACSVLALYSMCNRIAVVIIASASVIVFPIILNEKKLNGGIIFQGKGTAESEIADIFGFGLSDKDILAVFIPKSKSREKRQRPPFPA